MEYPLHLQEIYLYYIRIANRVEYYVSDTYVVIVCCCFEHIYYIQKSCETRYQYQILLVIETLPTSFLYCTVRQLTVKYIYKCLKHEHL